MELVLEKVYRPDPNGIRIEAEVILGSIHWTSEINIG